MEVELLGRQGIVESLSTSQSALDMAIRDTYLALNSAAGTGIVSGQPGTLVTKCVIIYRCSC